MKIGPHIHKGDDTMVIAINKAKEFSKSRAGIDITVAGLFIMEPNGYNFIVSDNDISQLSNYVGIDLYVHNSYLAHPWVLDRKCNKSEINTTKQNNKSKVGIHFINKQLSVCDRIKAKGFIIHLPKNGIDMTLNILKKIYNPNINTRIFLEIPAICPENSIFHKPTVLNNLFNKIKEEIDPTLTHFGLCIDTAHLWSCGVDISEYRSAEDWLNELTIEPECVMIHCNDNDKNLGNAPDIHNSITKGKIWSSINLQESGLYAFLVYAKKYNVPIILERKNYKMLIDDYKILNMFM